MIDEETERGQFSETGNIKSKRSYGVSFVVTQHPALSCLIPIIKDHLI